VDVFSVAGTASDGAGALTPLGGGASSDDADLGWAWFANLEYGFGDRDGTDNEDSYEADSFGGLIGVDYAFNEAWTLGVAYEYANSDIEFDRQTSGGLESVSGGDMDADSQTISVFVNYASEALYASAIVSAGSGEIDMTRPVIVPLASSGGVSGGLAPLADQATADTDSDSLSAEGRIGYTFGESATSWDVYGGLSGTNLEIDSFTESGSVLGLSYDDQEIDSFQGFLGVAVGHAVGTQSGVVLPYASVEYRYEFENESRNLDARYTLTPGVNTTFFTEGETDNFQILTDDADSSYFDVTVGVSAQFRNNFLAFLQYGTLLGLEDTTASLVTLGIRGSF
jgi:uncharacterized protein YhjY with autotransporter beta-barrel domain